MQVYDSAMCGYFCVEFIDFILESKTLLIFFHQIISKNKIKIIIMIIIII